MGKARPRGKAGPWRAARAGPPGIRRPCGRSAHRANRGHRPRGRGSPEGHRIGRQVAQGAVRAVPRGPTERQVPVEPLVGGDLDRFDLVEVGRHGLDRHPVVVFPRSVDARDFPDVGLGLPGAGFSDHGHNGAASAVILHFEAGPDHALLGGWREPEEVERPFSGVGVLLPGTEDPGVAVGPHLCDERPVAVDRFYPCDDHARLGRHDGDPYRRQPDRLRGILRAVGQELHRVAQPRHEGVGVIADGVGFPVGAEGLAVRRGRPFERRGVVIPPPWPWVLR